MKLKNKIQSNKVLFVGVVTVFAAAFFFGQMSLSFNDSVSPKLQECRETQNTGTSFSASCEDIGNLADPQRDTIYYMPETVDDRPLGISHNSEWYQQFHVNYLTQRKGVDASTVNSKCGHILGRGFVLCTDSDSTAETIQESFGYTRTNNDESDQFKHVIEFRPRGGVKDAIKQNVRAGSCSVTLNLEDYDDNFQVKTFEGDLSTGGTGFACEIDPVNSGDVQEIGEPRLVQPNVETSISVDMSFKPENVRDPSNPSNPSDPDSLSVDERVVRFIGNVLGLDSLSSWNEGEPLF